MCTQYSLLKYIKPPPPQKGKCTTTMYTMLHNRTKIPSAALDLAPHSKMTTFCLLICLHPSSMDWTQTVIVFYQSLALGQFIGFATTTT